jgi:Ca2+-binding EF-hand superfamily protein
MIKLHAAGIIVSLVLVLPGWAFAAYSQNRLDVPDSVFQSLNESNLSQAEIKAQRQNTFSKMDINQDGRVSKDEFVVYEKTIFIEMNTKDDAVLTADEINESCKSYFICLDANKDNQVTAREFNEQLEGVFDQIDVKNKDNYISKEEYFNYLISKDKAAPVKSGSKY